MSIKVRFQLIMNSLKNLSNLSPSVFAFTMVLNYQPTSLDPTQLSIYDFQPLIGSLFRGLFFVSSEGEAKPYGAKKCFRKAPREVICQLSTRKYSDGTIIVAEDYVRAITHFLGPNSKTPEVEVLMNIKNARRFHAGEALPLGARALDKSTLSFLLENPDPEFEYKLAHPLLFPWQTLPQLTDKLTDKITNKLNTNGPYRVIQTPTKQSPRLVLDQNPHFESGHPLRPTLVFRFAEDETAIEALYDSGEIDLIRRIPTLSIKKYEKRKNFTPLPQARFDYIGFGPNLLPHPTLREHLTQSTDNLEFQKLFDSVGPPGCPSFSPELLDTPRCYTKTLAKPLEVSFNTLRFVINQAGGEDLRRAATWYQAQWKKNLGVKIDIHPIESRVFFDEVRRRTPDLFRMGVPLQRPTCLAAMELFHSNSANNFIGFKDSEFDQILDGFSNLISSREKKRQCGKALDRLMKNHRMIPLGRFQLFMIYSDKFAGIEVNELNHFNFENLHPVGH